MVRGVRSQSGQRLPALRSYMDDVTSLLQTAACTARILKRFEELLGWARMREDDRRSLLTPGGDWNFRVDLDRQLKFPSEITTTSLRPDITLWSPSVKTVILAELTVPWEGGMEAAFERKEKYTELAAECREAGWSTVICPVEVGCREFIGTSIQRLLRNVGVTGPKLKKASKDLAGGKSKLLAVAKKEGHVVGKTRVLGVAAEGGRETSLPLLHHREMFKE